MYMSGHILTSTLASEFAGRKAKIGFGAFLAIVIAAGSVDADHLWGYQSDDGTANSFLLYRVHHFWWILVGLAAAGALFFRRARPYLVPLALGLGVHFAMDLLADLAGYDLAMLVAADVLCCLAVILCARPCGLRTGRMASFAAAAFAVPWLGLAVQRYVFLLDPSQTPSYHIVNLTINTGFALWAWFGMVPPGTR